MTTATYQSIPVDQIIPSRHQVRKNFTEESIKSLAESIKQEGQLMPIIVRPVMRTEDSGLSDRKPISASDVSQSSALSPQSYELVTGERRWRAAKLLGWKEIDAKVIETVSEAEAVAKGMVENLQREDLDPIEEAQGLADLNRLDPGYWSQDKIAEVSGKSKSHISESIRFLNLPDQIQEKFRQRNLTHEHGAELLRLPTPEVQQKVADAIVSQDLTVKKTRDLVNKMLQHKQVPAGKTGRPRKDPLASLWPGLLTSEAIPGAGAWAVAFKKGKWNFAVDSSAVSSKEALAAWFKQMGEAIAQGVLTPPDDKTAVVAPEIRNPGPSATDDKDQQHKVELVGDGN